MACTSNAGRPFLWSRAVADYTQISKIRQADVTTSKPSAPRRPARQKSTRPSVSRRERAIEFD